MQHAMALLGIHPVISKNIVCPFPDHNDTDPSCSIKKRSFRCWGQGCKKRGDATEFVRLVKGLAPRNEAIIWICQQSGISRDPKREGRDASVDEKMRLLAQVLDWTKHEENFKIAYDYLEKRGIDQALCEKYDIRYFKNVKPDAMFANVPEPERTCALKLLTNLGLISSYDNFLIADRVVFPQYHHGRPAGLTARTIRSNDLRPKYIFLKRTPPPLPETLFNLDECADLSSVYMVEGPIDALTLIQHGITNVVAICGTNGLSKSKILALKPSRIRIVTIVLDTDPNEAGQNGAMTAGKLLFMNGFTPRVKSLPFRNGTEKQDAITFFQDGGTVEQFDAIPARDWYELTLDAIHVDPADSPVQRTAALKSVYDLIGRLPHSAHEHYQSVILAKFPELKKNEIVENVKQAHRRHNESERLTAHGIKQLICAREQVIADGAAAIYRYANGVYIPWPEQEIASRIIEIRKRASDDRDPSSFEIREVLTFIRAENHVPQERFNPRGYLNTKKTAHQPGKRPIGKPLTRFHFHNPTGF